jgi:MFS family permease
MKKPDKTKGGRPVLIVTTIGSFLMPVALSAVNVALPSIGKDLAIDAILLSWIALAFTLAAGMFLVPFGKLAEIWGQGRIFIAGNWVFTIASFFIQGHAGSRGRHAFRNSSCHSRCCLPP